MIKVFCACDYLISPGINQIPILFNGEIEFCQFLSTLSIHTEILIPINNLLHKPTSVQFFVPAKGTKQDLFYNTSHKLAKGTPIGILIPVDGKMLHKTDVLLP